MMIFINDSAIAAGTAVAGTTDNPVKAALRIRRISEVLLSPVDVTVGVVLIVPPLRKIDLSFASRDCSSRLGARLLALSAARPDDRLGKLCRGHCRPESRPY